VLFYVSKNKENEIKVYKMKARWYSKNKSKERKGK